MLVRCLAALVAAVVCSACTPEDVVTLIFGDHASAALRVAQCESRLDPAAVSSTNDHGLFQINGVHRPAFERVTGIDWASGRYNAIANTEYARHLFDTQGWRPWSCSP